jgi:hypothetical protein
MCFCGAIKQRKGIIESCYWICTKHTDCGFLISRENPAKTWRFVRTSIDVKVKRESRREITTPQVFTSTLELNIGIRKNYWLSMNC